MALTAAAALALASGTGGGAAIRFRRPRLRLAPLTTLGRLKPAPPPGPLGHEHVPVPAASLLAGAGTKATGRAVDGIRCLPGMNGRFHIHAHLTIFVNGTARQIPAGIGIHRPQTERTPWGPFVTGAKCYYWLHTHTPDGIIHIESSLRRTFTLGNFFDEWGEPLSRARVGPARGHVTALYNGKAYLGDPRHIPLTRYAQIQLEVGAPLIAPTRITWPRRL